MRTEYKKRFSSLKYIDGVTNMLSCILLSCFFRDIVTLSHIIWHIYMAVNQEILLLSVHGAFCYWKSANAHKYVVWVLFCHFLKILINRLKSDLLWPLFGCQKGWRKSFFYWHINQISKPLCSHMLVTNHMESKHQFVLGVIAHSPSLSGGSLFILPFSWVQYVC